METSAKRTLIKITPELWEVASEPERLLGWTRELTGAPGAGYEVLESEPERLLRWRARAQTLPRSGWSYPRAALEPRLGFGRCSNPKIRKPR